MQISLNQEEIEQAILKYITELGIAVDPATAQMTFTSGRSDKGLTVDINVETSVIKRGIENVESNTLSGSGSDNSKFTKPSNPEPQAKEEEVVVVDTSPAMLEEDEDIPLQSESTPTSTSSLFS